MGLNADKHLSKSGMNVQHPAMSDSQSRGMAFAFQGYPRLNHPRSPSINTVVKKSLTNTNWLFPLFTTVITHDKRPFRLMYNLFLPMDSSHTKPLLYNYSKVFSLSPTNRQKTKHPKQVQTLLVQNHPSRMHYYDSPIKYLHKIYSFIFKVTNRFLSSFVCIHRQLTCIQSLYIIKVKRGNAYITR